MLILYIYHIKLKICIKSDWYHFIPGCVWSNFYIAVFVTFYVVFMPFPRRSFYLFVKDIWDLLFIIISLSLFVCVAFIVYVLRRRELSKYLMAVLTLGEFVILIKIAESERVLYFYMKGLTGSDY